MEEVEVKHRKRRKLNYVWFLPIIAFFVVAYLFMAQHLEKGKLITIQFKKAEGIAIGKTKLRYKDIDFGVVEDIKLADDLESITVYARVNNTAAEVLHRDTKFWIVKPRVGLTQVTGLETLLSGVYITISPSKEGEKAIHFIGLDEPPLVSNDENGLKLTLTAENALAVNAGTIIYYKGIDVGTVERRYFSDDYKTILVDVFIREPHNKLINSNTRFWRASGISLETKGGNFSLQVDSLEALVAGGVSFDTFDGLSQNEPIENGSQQQFILYRNATEAKSPIYSDKTNFVLYFEGSIRGLEEGAPVEFNGMPVGEVKDISLLYDSNKGKPVIPVLIEIYEQHLSKFSRVLDSSLAEKLNALVRHGLYAQLETSSLISGAKYVSLVIDKDLINNPIAIETDQLTGFTILPTKPESITQITVGVTRLLNKIDNLPLQELVSNLNNLVESSDKVVSDKNIGQAIANLNTLLAEGKTIPADIKTTLDGLNKSLKAVSDDVDSALTGLSPDAPLYYNLNNTLLQLEQTLRSIESVTDLIDRTPNALIFGEDRNDKK